jgi:eukaryotic-like serine/threonine-protein kinase
MVGTRVTHYEILDKLGEGGMGVVYKARDTHLDRFVAIKVLPADKVADPERKRRFVHEAKAASALNHPNIVTIYDISSDGGQDFIAMEYVAGKTLDQLKGRDGLPVSVALKYAIQIADALARAHSAGIVHRDLKPSNIMVDEHGLVKVLDFGLAKLTQASEASSEESTLPLKPTTDEGVIVGTAAYMSPEQAQGLKVDVRTDIFSFGAVLYEMLSGRRAFHGKSTMDTLAAILNKEPEALDSKVPHEVGKVVSRCLRKERERRYQHMDDVHLALQELKEESESGTLAGARPTKRPYRRVAIWAGTALAVGLLVGGGWYLRTAVRKSNPPLVAVPLTSYPGFQVQPSFSPDSKQVVFSWNGEKQDNWDIYVKMIGSPTPLRLTTNPAADFAPSFSPDGQSIGFMRGAGEKASFIIIPALGGPERVVGDNLPVSFNARGNAGRVFDWLPDGKWIVTDGLSLLSIESGESHRLTTPAGPSTPDFSPAVSPDGRTIAFCRSSGFGIGDIWLLDLTEDLKPKAEPRRLTHLNPNLSGLAWISDGKGIVYSAGAETNRSIWRVSISGSGPPERLQFGAEDVSAPAVARNGNRLAFQRGRYDINIHRLALSDSRVPLARPALFGSSTRNEDAPQYSPDGTRIAFASDRGGDWSVWVSDADGSNAIELVSGPGTDAGTPRWSPDSTKIAFDWNADGNWNVYVIRSRGGKPVHLTSDPADDVIPSWSRSGKWIYFASTRSGRYEVWKAPANGGAAIQVTMNGGCVAFESADAASLYYTKEYTGTAGLWRTPLGGGEERQMLSAVSRRSFFVAAKGVYFMTPRSPAGEFSIQFLNTTTGKVTTISTIAEYPGNGLSVSPDGRFIIYPQFDILGQDLMLVENFR